MSLSTREAGRSTVIAVRGERDLDNAGELDEALAAAGRACPGAVVLDVAAVTFMDSTTINVVLRAHGVLGPQLRLAALSPFVERVLGITGISDLLPVFPSVGEALEADAV
ncbi:STAS domain-containing protein [Streptomyces sp. NPDC059340]|uniref:STAS domain-containing protein n=1 Tax=Streptomyces sp. NPDC059340 TaxID=3346806 RepID=UPI0036A57BAE